MDKGEGEVLFKLLSILSGYDHNKGGTSGGISLSQTLTKNSGILYFQKWMCAIIQPMEDKGRNRMFG